MAKGAEKYCKVNKVLPKVNKYTGIPPRSEWELNPDTFYVYYCKNETSCLVECKILWFHDLLLVMSTGAEFHYVPHTGDVPLVCNMFSKLFLMKLIKSYLVTLHFY